MRFEWEAYHNLGHACGREDQSGRRHKGLPSIVQGSKVHDVNATPNPTTIIPEQERIASPMAKVAAAEKN